MMEKDIDSIKNLIKSGTEDNIKFFFMKGGPL